jgi:hypothetical protein
VTELTRNEFYKLSRECRDYALRLAKYDQRQVDRQVCNEFNQFLARMRTYDRLQAVAAKIVPARPLTRAMVLITYAVLNLVLMFLLSPALGGLGMSVALSIFGIGLLVIFFVPPGLYGTTVEQVEGKVLRIVQALQGILESNALELTEAVYFQVKETLDEAAAELRQQVFLANERVRR